MSPSRNSIFIFISNFHSHPGLQCRGRKKGPVRQNVGWEGLFAINRQTKDRSENFRWKERCSLPPDIKMHVLPLCTSAVHRDLRSSAESDTIFCHSCRETAVIQNPHRERHLINGNERSYAITLRKPSPISDSFGCHLHPKPCISQYFPTVTFNYVMKYLLDKKIIWLSTEERSW